MICGRHVHDFEWLMKVVDKADHSSSTEFSSVELQEQQWKMGVGYGSRIAGGVADYPQD